MVFYRKYRPQKIEELDNAAVREVLSAVLKRGNTHAFLFTGPKGLGKTSTARIVAKAVNCTTHQKESTKNQGLKTNDQIEPCNICESCISITNGTNLDVFEIDAASNRGIDEIRELKERITLAPINAKKKVYIIDEVHMLTTEAFNALLKTLEEPPAHAMFILCTTEDQKIPATILSRCFHISFFPATKEELIRSFTRIAKGEELQVDQETLGLIADLAEGGFRDGAKIMEELAVLSTNKTITKELVEEKYNVFSIRHLSLALLQFLQKYDEKNALQLISQLSEQNISHESFLEELLALLHANLLATYDIHNAKYQIKEVLFSTTELLKLLAVFSRAVSEMKYAVISSLPLELAVIAWCTDNGASNVQHATFKHDREETAEEHVREKTKERNNDETGEVTVTTLRKQVGNMAKIKALYGEEKEVAKTKKNNDETMGVSILDFSADGEITSAWLTAFWKALIAEMKTYNHTLAGVLRGCMIKSYDRKSLVIETAYTFHKEKLDEGKTMQMLEQVCKTLTGKPVAVSIVLQSK